ncbi:unnamed protein product [Prorocentrum cordatum]|uniref:SET domain-containing protein n=1 Tax=Prorocentrum cordatum TaxID=2364126 RepID=A0ABN9TTS4_9DINO|nr:unnamed protein product [Polarella glacialis]
MCSHSCSPNSHHIWHLADGGGRLTLRSRCRIEAGEEVTISYLSTAELYLPVLERRRALLLAKKFQCACPRCADDLDDTRAFECHRCGGEAFASVTATFHVPAERSGLGFPLLLVSTLARL